MKTFPSLLATLCAAGLASSALAQNATTTPVGAMTYTLNATVATTSTYLSVPLTSSPTYSGAVASLTSTTVSFSGTPFAAGALAQPGSPYFLRFQSGAQAGRSLLVTANTANTVTVDVTNNTSQTTNLDASGFSVVANDRVELYPGDTLASFLGDNTSGNPLLVVGAAGALSADTVSIYNRNTGKQDIYFFSTILGYWRLNSSTTNKNSVVLYPDASFALTRRAGRPMLSITVIGDVPSVAPLTKTAGGSQVVYGSSTYPVDLTLGELNLANWTKANFPLSADTVSIFNTSTQKMDVYYQKIDGTWRKSGDALTDKSSVVVPAGSALAFLKRGTVSGATSFLSTQIPYNL